MDKVEEQICCEVIFEDGSICDSIPETDLILVCPVLFVLLYVNGDL